jgi:hypothetical protein
MRDSSTLLAYFQKLTLHAPQCNFPFQNLRMYSLKHAPPPPPRGYNHHNQPEHSTDHPSNTILMPVTVTAVR